MEVNSVIGYVSLMGYYKLMGSLFKYIPQLLWNRKRKSTVGWSIFNVFMDLTGGFFSVL
jgi:cystinosin